MHREYWIYHALLSIYKDEIAVIKIIQSHLIIVLCETRGKENKVLDRVWIFCKHTAFGNQVRYLPISVVQVIFAPQLP